MKTITVDEMEEKEAVKETVSGYRESYATVVNTPLAGLFKEYFNDKMAAMIFLCYAVDHTPEENHLSGIYRCLDSLYLSMFEEDVQKRCRRKFTWLKAFLRRFPNVCPFQRVKAIALIRSLYEVFGIDFETKIGGALHAC